jgi:2-C-methyl-D-erythritol 2,4-cyclodiphosphate synthase
MEGFRIGHGYDVHKLVADRALVLGGVTVPHALGLDGHSDADVLLHAVMDAVLGALALGDIGKHFPDTEEKYRGISSMRLAAEVAALMRREGYCIGNVDATVVAQKPRLAQYIAQMRENIANAFGCAVSAVNVKATTEERLGFTGREEGIAAHAVCICIKEK